MAEQNYDVLVAGGCSAGLYFAAQMARQGYRVLVIEKDSESSYGKRYDIFHLETKTFERFGIELPEQDSEEFVRKFTNNISRSALDRYPKLVKNEMNVLHRRPFMKRLKKWAQSHGVTVLHEASFSSLVYDDAGKISGAIYKHNGNNHEVSVRLVADASGIASVVRTSLSHGYGVENFVISPRDKFYVILYYAMLTDPDQDRVNETVSWPYYKTWKAPQADQDGAILGVGANISFKYAEACFKKFAEKVALPPHRVMREEKECTPYRRSPYSFVSDGFVVLGDAACLTNPMSGEGITTAWVHAKIAAEEAGSAMQQDGYPTRRALWAVNTRYNAVQGSEFAQTRSMLAGAVSCSAEENDYEFSKSIIFTGDDDSEDGGLIGKIVKGVFSGGLGLSTLSSLVGAAVTGGKIRKHYDAFPEDPEDFPAWQKKADKLWSKARNMADDAEKDMASGS